MYSPSTRLGSPKAGAEGIFIRTRLVYTAYPLYAGPRAPATCALCCDCVLSLAVARARGGAPHSGAPLSI